MISVLIDYEINPSFSDYPDFGYECHSIDFETIARRI